VKKAPRHVDILHWHGGLRESVVFFLTKLELLVLFNMNSKIYLIGMLSMINC